jgi:predicted dehydrogenase
MQRFPSLRGASSLVEIVDLCDAVMVATPVNTHYTIAKMALQAGKAVFVEKPLTNNSIEADELVALAEEQGVVLMAGHTFIFSPPVRKIKQYIDEGALGQTYFISSSRVNLGLHRRDVNVIWDLAPHDISMLIYWLGESPNEVSAVGRACVGPMIDVASIHMRFPSGTLANIEVSWLAPSKLRRTVIVGSKRMVVYDDTLPSEKVRLYDRSAVIERISPKSFGEYQLTYRDGDLLSPYLDNTEPLLTQTNYFIDCIEHGTHSESDGRLASQVVAVTEAACCSAEQNGAMVAVRNHHASEPVYNVR